MENERNDIAAGNCIKETLPSLFTEVIRPVIPEFSAEKKKPVGRRSLKLKRKLTREEEEEGMREKRSKRNDILKRKRKSAQRR